MVDHLHSGAGRFRARLLNGPATAEDLAQAVWGAEWNWPLTWDIAIRVYICDFRKRLRDRDLEIYRSNLYSIKPWSG